MAAGLAGCHAAPVAVPPPPVPTGPASFPADWIGHWSGPARLVWPDGRRRDFTMELIIAPTADPKRFTWTVVYAEGENRQERPYELVVIDAAEGRYEIDEKNGIRLPTTAIGGTLRAAFTVQGVQVVTCERIDRSPAGERLVSEMVSFDARDPISTGGEGEIPAVTTFRASTVQMAELTKGASKPTK
jgi:hypothetical protein